MNKDLVYIYDKLTRQRQVLGEIETGFNMSLTIDGTKDSTKINVWSYEESEIEPFTICWHEKTNTWWIVAHDKIERYLNEDSTFTYIHSLQLLGAIELLNARDLTDCGFNQNRYTKGQFLNRLISLSSFEFQGNDFEIVANSNFLNQKVDFIKTYENYSLLSAIRDFLDSYNMCGKLEFAQTQSGNDYYLSKARLRIVNKTGDNTLPTHDINDFDDVRETKTMDKNSFGTCVVSNAENVISSLTKTYPSTGSVRASATTYNVRANDAVIRLPSNVYKGLWAKMFLSFAPISADIIVAGTTFSIIPSILGFNSADTSYGFKNLLENVRNYLERELPNWQPIYNSFISYFNQQKPNLQSDIEKLGVVTLYNGNKLVDKFPDNASQKGYVKIEKGDNVPNLALFDFVAVSSSLAWRDLPYIFCDEETKGMLPHKEQGIQWKRGSNIISGFDGFQASESNQQDRINLRYLKYTDYGKDTWEWLYVSNDLTVRLYVGVTGAENELDYGISYFRNTTWSFCYIPMSDIKIKVDNSRTKRDMHLYNQNGKLTDNVALSKMINSYAKEISSDTITKYMWYYNFADVPKVGSFVFKGNEAYVVNNVSCDFTQNENSNSDFGYNIECEITMSKYVSTKSLLVNPNTNIRDYGIPQNFNVKRKQVYRDYYELDYSLNVDQDTNYYLDPSRVFNFGRVANNNINFIAVIRCDYAENVGGDEEQEIPSNDVWYYQLETTTYNMNKMIYVVCDFNDNNIIGYASQNVYSGFVIKRIFTGQTDLLNTPISYVDSNGEVEHIYVKLCDIEQLTNIYEYYREVHYGDIEDNDWVGSLYNYSCFIPSDIYEGLTSNDYSMLISEPYYKKDAIEVPVFEYAFQIDDSENVLIGDNILTQHENCIYFYYYMYGDNFTQDNIIDITNIAFMSNPTRYRMYDSASVNYFDLDTDLKVLEVRIHSYTTYNRETDSWSTMGQFDIPEGKDLAIFRHAYNLVTGEETVELMFIAKKVPSSVISGNNKVLTLTLNHYKL